MGWTSKGAAEQGEAWERKRVSEEEAGSQQLTCDEGPCWHLAVIGACGTPGADGCGAEGRPAPPEV